MNVTDFIVILQTYVKSKVKSKQLTLVQQACKMLCDAELRLHELPKGSWQLRLLSRKICVCSMEAVEVFVAAKDWTALTFLVQSQTLAPEEVLLVVAVNCIGMLEEVCNNVPVVRVYLEENRESVNEMFRADKGCIKTITEYLDKQQLDVVREKLKQLGVSKEKLASMLDKL